jgi:DNA-binding MarR family transcriptional regulator
MSSRNQPARARDAAWLAPEEQQAWRAYQMGTELLQSQLDRELREEHGLALSEYEILVRLSESPGRRMRMALLAEAMSHSRSRVTHTVARMERDGLVAREAAAADGRGVEAVMTEGGNQRLVEAAPSHVRGVREHFVSLATPEDFQAVGRVFDAVSDQLLEGRPAAADIR